MYNNLPFPTIHWSFSQLLAVIYSKGLSHCCASPYLTAFPAGRVGLLCVPVASSSLPVADSGESKYSKQLSQSVTNSELGGEKLNSRSMLNLRASPVFVLSSRTLEGIVNNDRLRLRLFNSSRSLSAKDWLRLRTLLINEASSSWYAPSPWSAWCHSPQCVSRCPFSVSRVPLGVLKLAPSKKSPRHRTRTRTTIAIRIISSVADSTDRVVSVMLVALQVAGVAQIWLHGRRSNSRPHRTAPNRTEQVATGGTIRRRGSYCCFHLPCVSRGNVGVKLKSTWRA